jgi:hypothetical protein
VKEINDKLVENKNMLYYNQMIERDRKNQSAKRGKARKNSNTFGSQKINLKNYIFIPDGMEYLAYIFYIVGIPYVTGAIFLFYTVAGGDFHNFELISLGSFFIVWAIGYEISATLTLIYIVYLFLTFDSDDE